MADITALVRVLERRTGARTTRDIAIKSGITPDLLGKWQRGDLAPTLKQLRRIADHFGINEADLLREIAADVDESPAQSSTSGSLRPATADDAFQARIEKHLDQQVGLLKDLQAAIRELAKTNRELTERVTTLESLQGGQRPAPRRKAGR